MATETSKGIQREVNIVNSFTNKPIKTNSKDHQAIGTTPTNQIIWYLVSAFIQTKLVEVCKVSTGL